MPAPNVDSCVVRFNIKAQAPNVVSDEAFFFRVVRAAFSQRRKTLANSVSSGGFSKQIVIEAIKNTGLEASIRPEQLSMEDFIAFSEALKAVQ